MSNKNPYQLSFPVALPLARSRAGFALIEIMVVVAILSVAAAILVPKFLKSEIKKKQLECRQSLQALFAAEKDYFEKNGKYTDDVTSLNWSPTGARYEYRFTSPVSPLEGFRFECFGNIDNDPTTDHAAVDQTGTITQLTDDSEQ